jgi:DNA-binding beta-propeller fold protein YncE
VDVRQNKIFKVDPSNGTILTALDSPSDNPEGLAWDGETLWLSDATAKTIMRLDLDDGTEVKTFAAPAGSPQGLAWDGTYLWCADRLSDELHMIDPTSGEAIIILKSPGPYPRGIAYDGTCLWNIDFQTDQIYQLVRQDQELYHLENPRSCCVTLTHQARVYGNGRLQKLDVYFAIPKDRPEQTISKIEFKPSNPQNVQDRWGQSLAHFVYTNKPVETFECDAQTKVEVETFGEWEPLEMKAE